MGDRLREVVNEEGLGRLEMVRLRLRGLAMVGGSERLVSAAAPRPRFYTQDERGGSLVRVGGVGVGTVSSVLPKRPSDALLLCKAL